MEANFSKYAELFGHAPDFVRAPVTGADPQVSVGRFPPKPTSFLRRFLGQGAGRWTHVTWGMSAKPMRVSSQDGEKHAERIELLARSQNPIVGTRNGEDLISAVLQVLAAVPFAAGIFFAPGFTAQFDEPFCSNSEMRAFLFTEPAGYEMSRLCSCTPGAQLVLSATPITVSERNYLAKHGPRSLIELFQKHGVPNLFDPFRKSVI